MTTLQISRTLKSSSETMCRLIPSILIVSILAVGTGCSGEAGLDKGYKSKSGDLGAFILASTPRFGVRILTTNDLPTIRAKWRYKEASNEFHVMVEGDYFPQLHAFLTKAVGPPPGLPSTKSVADLRRSGAYYGTNLGATVSCGGEQSADGKQYTGFVIISYAQPGSVQAAKVLGLLAQEAEKGDQYFSALDAARPSAPYVSDFVRLFPAAQVNYRYFTGTGEPGFNVSVDLYERYEIGMQLPVRFDSSRRNVVGYGEPRFHIGEASSVKGRETWYKPPGGRSFGSEEWKKIVDSGGDFGAIGYAMITNQPVAGFKDRNIQD